MYPFGIGYTAKTHRRIESLRNSTEYGFFSRIIVSVPFTKISKLINSLRVYVESIPIDENQVVGRLLGR